MRDRRPDGPVKADDIVDLKIEGGFTLGTLLDALLDVQSDATKAGAPRLVRLECTVGIGPRQEHS